MGTKQSAVVSTEKEKTTTPKH